MAKRRAKAARRSYRRARTKRSRSSKTNLWKMMKGAVYVGSVVAPMYSVYKQTPGGVEGISHTLQNAVFINPTTGGFEYSRGATIWTPIVIVAAVDFITTKLPIQRVISRGINNIL